MAASSPQADYKQEVRFAVVMYGGVSLAIYINGVAQELYRLVRSTAEVEPNSNGKRSPVPANEISNTERVYRKLSYVVSDAELLKSYREYVQRIEKHRVQLAKEALDEATRKDRLAELIKAEGIDPLEDALVKGKEIETRFVVDILSGTSAGGINAIYLAKALANDQQIKQLRDLWVNEGDLALLLNDKRSVRGLQLRNQSPPQSLLNSRRMYFKLLKSLDDMEAAHPSQDHFKSPYVDELDLFITATDIEGVPVPLRLADSVVYERRHRNVFHFKYAKEEVVGDDFNDFRGAFNPFLAFAARCTSSFPFAFEPMRLRDIDEVLNLLGGDLSLVNSDSEYWQRFFQEELDPQTGAPVRPPRFAQRSFGDGGYLDNKPFSYATETLMHRQADVPVDRKLIYIEPSPDHPEDKRSRLEKPNALQNVKAAVLELPTYETIREDLQRVLERNQLIVRVNRIISGIERDVSTYIPHAIENYLNDRSEKPWSPAAGTGSGGVPDPDSTKARPSVDWKKRDLADMVTDYGRYFLPYRRLRVASVTDDIARLVTRLGGFDENSDQFLAIRNLVRAWREENYLDYKEKDRPTVNQFLWEFDLSYRLRRLSATRSKVDQLTRIDESFLQELEDYTRSLERIRAVVTFKSMNVDKDWEEVKDRFPQIRLQIYGDRLLPIAKERPEALFRTLRIIKSELNEVFKEMRTTGRMLRSRQRRPPRRGAKETDNENLANPLLEHIAKIKITPTDLNWILGMSKNTASEIDLDEKGGFKRAKELLQRPDLKIREAMLATGNELRDQLGAAFEWARKQTNGLFNPAAPYTPISDRGKELLAADPELLVSEIGQTVRGFISYYYNNFDDYDQIRFPILYETEVGESDIIEIIRISPEDAVGLINEREEVRKSSTPKLARQKLAGVSLAHFGAFLDRTWRVNDIMWGRLDGVERLLKALLPGSENELVRKELAEEARPEIIKEELQTHSHLGFDKVISEALLNASSGLSPKEAIDKTLKPLQESAVKTRLEEIMRLRLSDDKLTQFIRDSYEVNRQLDPKSTLNSVSRATQIIGKMFEQMAEDNGLEGKRVAWVARSGRVFWGLVEVAAPKSLLNLLLFHWLKVLYFFEALLIIGSIVINEPKVQTFGLKLFAVTLVLNLGVLLLRDYMRLRHRWQRLLLVLFAAFMLLLSAIGAVHLYRYVAQFLLSDGG